MSYLFGRCSVGEPLETSLQRLDIGPTRRVEARLALTFQRLLEAQDPDQRRSHGLRARG